MTEGCAYCGCTEIFEAPGCVCECHQMNFEENNLLSIIIAVGVTVLFIAILVAELHVHIL